MPPVTSSISGQVEIVGTAPHGRDRVEEHLGAARRLRRSEERRRPGHRDVRRHGAPGRRDDALALRAHRELQNRHAASLFSEPLVMQ